MKTAKMAPETSSLLLRISLVLEVVGFVLHSAGFTTPFWRSLHFKYSAADRSRVDLLIQGFDEGLWRRCINGICADIDISGRDWLQAVRVFESLALLASCVAVVLIILYFLSKRLSENRHILLITFISCFVMSGSVMLATITYGSSVKVGITWSFGLAVFGGACYVISGFLMLITYFSVVKKS